MQLLFLILQEKLLFSFIIFSTSFMHTINNKIHEIIINFVNIEVLNSMSITFVIDLRSIKYKMESYG